MRTAGIPTPPPGVKLPAGSRFLPVLRAHFSAQAIACQVELTKRLTTKALAWHGRHIVLKDGEPVFVPDDFFDFHGEWDESLKGQVQPVVELYWKQGGQTAHSRIGIAPTAFSVRPPGVQLAIDQAAFSLSRAVNETTWRRMGEVVAGLKSELADGLFHGDTHEELIDRVQGVFTEASEYRAHVIAQTEAARAVHMGALDAARQSDGLVIGKRWLLSGNPCPLCVAIAERNLNRQLPLDASFAHVGDHPDYADVIVPPAHPGCMCSMEEILAPEMNHE